METFWIIIAVLLSFAFYPFVMAKLSTPKEKSMGKKAANEHVFDGETQAEKFIAKVESLPIVDKYNTFHTDVKKGNKVFAVELTIKGNNRTTLYEFPDHSYLEISESYQGSVMEAVVFKAI